MLKYFIISDVKTYKLENILDNVNLTFTQITVDCVKYFAHVSLICF